MKLKLPHSPTSRKTTVGVSSSLCCLFTAAADNCPVRGILPLHPTELRHGMHLRQIKLGDSGDIVSEVLSVLAEVPFSLGFI